MKNLFKILSIIALVVVLNGCASSQPIENSNCTTNQAMTCSGKFNEEQYIWQSFLFPTNRTSGVQ